MLPTRRDADFAAWYFKPYRSIIERNLPLFVTEGVDLSFDVQAMLQVGRLMGVGIGM